MAGTYRIAVIPGEGIGPEVVNAALKVLNAVQEAVKDVRFEFLMCEAGVSVIPKYGTNLPEETVEKLKQSHACFKGPVTTPEEPGSPVSVAVKIRTMFDLYANIRPARSLPNVPCLRPDIDLVIVRENTEGFYYAKEFEVAPGVGISTRLITRKASERVTRFAFNLARKRRRKLTYVHKANILKLTDSIFKQAVLDVAKEYPEVELEELRVDAAAMQLVRRPQTFDVIVTTNMFGDILSDEAAGLVGGLGLAAGANLGEKYGMFEPVHGSAPKYAGQNKVNPVATILAAKMLLEFLGETRAAEKVEKAVIEVLREGKVKTYDLGGSATTSQMAEAIAEKVLENA